MGCIHSKIEDEESVSRCRRQKQFVKLAVKSRIAFAEAHASYLCALQRVGTAFRKFADGEFRGQTSVPATPTISTSLTSLPATPASDDLSKSILPLALKNTPSVSKTVILSTPSDVSVSPARTPKYNDVNKSPARTPKHNDVNMSPARTPKQKSDDDNYLYEAPLLDLYRSMLRSASGSFPNDFGSPSSPPPVIHGWDWFNLFEAPAVPVVYREQRSYIMQMRGQEAEAEQDFGQERIHEMEIDEPHVKNTEKQEEEKTESQKERDREETIQEKVELQQEKAEKNLPPHDLMQAEQTQESDGKKAQAEERSGAAKDNVITALEPASIEIAEQKNGSETKEMEVIVSPKKMDMRDVLRNIEEEFLRASESGKEVSRLLEANKTQQHSGFLDPKGLSEHSYRLLRGLSWSSWSPRTTSSSIGMESSEESSTNEDTIITSSHASTLEKLYDWQKKLYQEVKEVEILNIELEKKLRLLQTLNSRGHDEAKMEKAGGDIKTLHTQMTVTIHAMEATLAKIKKIRDEEMLPQLLELLEGLANMWTDLSECHRLQREALLTMVVPADLPLESTGESHKGATIELEDALNSWQLIFTNLTSSQKEYAQNLNGWLRFSLTLKPEKETKKASLTGESSTYIICKSWQTQLEKLSHKPVIEAIKMFSDKIHNIVVLQVEKQKVQRRRAALAKEISKKSLLLNQEEKRSSELVPGKHDNSTVTIENSLAEKKEHLETLQKHIEEENAKFVKAIEEIRSLTIDGIHNVLPKVFQALSEFASKCSRAYQDIASEVKDEKTGQDKDKDHQT